jgi:hypothetical protein
VEEKIARHCTTVIQLSEIKQFAKGHVAALTCHGCKDRAAACSAKPRKDCRPLLHNLSITLGSRILPIGDDERLHHRQGQGSASLALRVAQHALLVLVGSYAAVSSAYAQASATTTINLATQTRNADFGTFPFTRPVAVGSALPSTCQVGQLFFNTTASPGSNLYGCTTANTWTTLGGGSTSTPQVTLTPTSLSFGNQTTGTTSNSATVTLNNTGTAYLSITGITLSGTNAKDFLVSNTCGTIVASGATCTISVVYQPTVIGSETATLNIAGNQPGSPTTLALSGTGVVAITSGGLVLTPSATYASENGTITFTSNRPVNWALATGSAGTLVVNSSTSATYTAPASIPSQNLMGACQVTPNDSVFNTRVDSLPLESHSATWTANMGSNGIGFFTSWGTNIADANTPVTSESFYYTTAYNGPFVTPKWPLLKREGGTFTTPFNSTDHHSITVRKDNCQFYEIYNDYMTPHLCRDNKTPGCTATSGFQYNWSSYGLPTGGATDAAGMPLAPLTLHLDEIKAGAIHHAMRFTVAGGFIHALPYWPANSGNGCGSCTNSPPYGARFRLKASYDISRFSAYAQTVLTALKQYGMFLADAGTGPTITTSTDLTEDPNVMWSLSQIAGASINMSNFEVVDESSFIVGTHSSQVNPNNSYVTPTGFAAVSATDQTNSTYQVTYPIPLQSVAVGLSSPTVTIIAGTTGYQLASWVNGTSNQNVAWSLVSGAGSVTAGGVYTPPATVASIATAVLKATSAADANASSLLYVTILPIGNNPAGSIRIDSGAPLGTTDASGNLWLGDQAFETGGYIELAGDYPGWPAQSNPEIKVYESSGYTYGNDLVYSLVVPNGNYKVRFMFGQNYNGCWPGCNGQPFNANWHSPLFLEANGQIGAHDFNMGIPINYQFATPTDAYIPAQVTNNNLVVALRADTPDTVNNANPSPEINGIEIIPDSSAPYITIDTKQQTSVAAGNTLQLYAVGWYMSNSVTWSLSGPGTISQTGLYTAPATATSAAQTVTITATSTATSGVQATAKLTIPGTGN